MNPIFVFGSNLAGEHVGGAARHAVQVYGAIMGNGEGLQGEAYALPTMDTLLMPRTLEEVAASVKRFLAFAAERMDLVFHITAVGCGIAGFRRTDIIPLFEGSPENCFFFEPAFGKVVP